MHTSEQSGPPPIDERARIAVILDTNVFVGAGFNPTNHSARLVEAVRGCSGTKQRGVRPSVFCERPTASVENFAPLFREDDRFQGETYAEEFDYVADPADRTFAALAGAAGVPLVTSDKDLLQGRRRARAPSSRRPSSFVNTP